MGVVESSTCRFCSEEEETPIHLLTNCGPLGGKRFGEFGSQFVEIEEILHFFEKAGLF